MGIVSVHARTSGGFGHMDRCTTIGAAAIHSAMRSRTNVTYGGHAGRLPGPAWLRKHLSVRAYTPNQQRGGGVAQRVRKGFSGFRIDWAKTYAYISTRTRGPLWWGLTASRRARTWWRSVMEGASARKPVELSRDGSGLVDASWAGRAVACSGGQAPMADVLNRPIGYPGIRKAGYRAALLALTGTGAMEQSKKPAGETIPRRPEWTRQPEQVEAYSNCTRHFKRSTQHWSPSTECWRSVPRCSLPGFSRPTIHLILPGSF